MAIKKMSLSNKNDFGDIFVTLSIAAGYSFTRSGKTMAIGSGR
jgi:hypothetical protein